MMEDLLPALNGPNSAIAVTAFSTLETRINNNNEEAIREFLRKWRCEPRPYMKTYNTETKEFLKSLTIFKTLDGPLFIDDYGGKRPMSHYIELEKNCRDLANNYEGLKERCNSRYDQAMFSSLGGKQVPVKTTTHPDYSGLLIGMGSGPFWVDAENFNIEDIPIDLDTPIVHVTHTVQKDLIVAGQKLDPSDNKNSVKGIWFSPKYQLGDPEGVMKSVYGNWAFETTLSKLQGVAGIRQGEIVSYPNEVNFILYACSDTEPPDPVMKKATNDAVKLSKDREYAYTTVSIFVPSRFLPQQGAAFSQAFEQLHKVSHRGFCVKARRSGTTCNELGKKNNTI